MMRTEVLRRLIPRLSIVGFKILLDIFVSSPTPLRYAELSYRFHSRSSGQSKMDAKVLLEFAELLIDKLVGRVVPAKFVIFSVVGSLGVSVHMAVLGLLFRGWNVEFKFAQTVATLTAMTSNFALNNVLTYYDRRLSGWAWIRGWFSFALASSIGIIANVGIATYLFRAQDATWCVSAVAGILVGVIWNYTVTSFVTWKSA
jgi:dolichol-phosphate mannosyltransferase